jgi:tetratricopeptide (TPR) repeat protein
MAGMRGLSGGLWLAVALLTALPVGAQTLDEVSRHLRDGRMQEARSALLAWERAADRPGRLDRQRALWLKGLLTLDPEQAAASYMRLVVEYPGGPFTDRALLRLAMAADVRGDTEEAAEHYTRLARDHPASPLGDDARAWLREHPDALAASDDPVGERGETGSPPQAGDGVFAVQLGAFSAPDGAEALADRARDAGFDVRTVRVDGDPFYRVRAGRFQDRTAAEQLRDRIRAAGFDATLSANADREQGRG